MWGGYNSQDCERCEGTGTVLGEIPTSAGYYYVKYGDGKIGLLEVDEDLYVLGIEKRGEDCPIQSANWSIVRDEPIVRWGPKVILTWSPE